jgi:hypothetical protein
MVTYSLGYTYLQHTYLSIMSPLTRCQNDTDLDGNHDPKKPP